MEWQRLPAQAQLVSSLVEYQQYFGGAFRAVFMAENRGDGTLKPTLASRHFSYLYNSLRLFFANGGRSCYVFSVGTYGSHTETFEVKAEDFPGNGEKAGPLSLLNTDTNAALIVAPDIVALGSDAYPFYKAVLQHCKEHGRQFGIFDLALPEAGAKLGDVVSAFRAQIGDTALRYGAAYVPWLNTTIVQPTELDVRNLHSSVDLHTLLPGLKVKQIIQQFESLPGEQKTDAACGQYHQSLITISPTYATLFGEILKLVNLLPPSGAVTGVYATIDTSRGVWKVPANETLNAVAGIYNTIGDEEQRELNVDTAEGKSVNAIRSFTGKGILVWGARTLAGNDNEWRYIQVRRLATMIEASIQQSLQWVVFEPNTAATWVRAKGSIKNFLTNLWRQGAFAGAKPADGFFVSIGLNETMTQLDIQNGVLNVEIGIAPVRPAEFIIIRLSQLCMVS